MAPGPTRLSPSIFAEYGHRPPLQPDRMSLRREGFEASGHLQNNIYSLFSHRLYWQALLLGHDWGMDFKFEMVVLAI